MPPITQAGLRTIPLGREEMFLCLPKRHPLSSRKTLSASDLTDLSFIVYRKNTVMQNVVDEWFELGVEPTITASGTRPRRARRGPVAEPDPGAYFTDNLAP